MNSHPTQFLDMKREDSDMTGKRLSYRDLIADNGLESGARS